MATEELRRLEVLMQVGSRLVRTAPSGRILLARLARAIDPRWISRREGGELLAELQAGAEAAQQPIEMTQIERALADAWGTRPGKELDGLESEPIAVTPTSQVHRGILEGSPVAVKVLRPGIAASVRQDLGLLEGLLPPLAAAFPSLDARAALRECRERVLDELDLEHEALTQRRVHRALRNHPFLVVPAPVMRLSHEGVLVSQWIDGVPLSRAPVVDRAAAQLVLFVLGSARFGVVHADPNPDDVLVLNDDRLAILDFGASREVAAERAALSLAALDAFLLRDPEAFGHAMQGLGWLPSEHAVAAFKLACELLDGFTGPAPVRLDAASVISIRNRVIRRSTMLGELALAGALPPEDLWPARAVLQLLGTVARVGATGPWLQLARAALREGFSAGLEDLARTRSAG